MLIGSAYRRLNPADDQSHEIDEGREQQFLLILSLSVVGEQLIKRLGIERVLQQCTGHHRDGALLGETFEHSIENHRRDIDRRML